MKYWQRVGVHPIDTNLYKKALVTHTKKFLSHAIGIILYTTLVVSISDNYQTDIAYQYVYSAYSASRTIGNKRFKGRKSYSWNIKIRHPILHMYRKKNTFKKKLKHIYILKHKNTFKKKNTFNHHKVVGMCLYTCVINKRSMYKHYSFWWNRCTIVKHLHT